MLSALTTTPSCSLRQLDGQARTCRWPSARLSGSHPCRSQGFSSWPSLPRLLPIRQIPFSTPALAEKAAEAVKASGLYWLADGIACDIALRDGTDPQAAEATSCAVDRRRADRSRRPGRGDPPQEAADRRHGFDHDRPGMHRRTGRRSRPEGQGRRHHRARHERRDRLRAGPARARRPAQGPADLASSTRSSQSASR